MDHLANAGSPVAQDFQARKILLKQTFTSVNK
jgi:hypothetical protein